MGRIRDGAVTLLSPLQVLGADPPETTHGTVVEEHIEVLEPLLHELRRASRVERGARDVDDGRLAVQGAVQVR